ncbi:hypothetical protein JCM5353_002341 [Sporobolomyces roseus]
MLSFKRNSLPSSSLPVDVKEPSKLKKPTGRDGEVKEEGWAKSLFRRRESVDSDKSSKRRGSADSDSSFLPSSASTSFFRSTRTSFSSTSSHSNPASTSTPSFHITPPSPSADDIELGDSQPPDVQWPFSSSSSSLSSSSSYAASTFSTSSSSLSTGADSSTRDSSLFLSYLLKYSFPSTTSTAQLIPTIPLRASVGGQDDGPRVKPRLVDYYLNSSLR